MMLMPAPKAKKKKKKKVALKSHMFMLAAPKR